jgi:hypothetical protein
MWKQFLADLRGEPLDTINCFRDKPVLAVESHMRHLGHFKSVTRTGSGTTVDIIVTPITGHCIQLTDLIVTSDKVQSATITLRFYDGTNTETIFGAEVSDAPCNIAIPFVGTWKGWTDARIELVTVNAVTVTVACGYLHLGKNHALDYARWSALRDAI